MKRLRTEHAAYTKEHFAEIAPKYDAIEKVLGRIRQRIAARLGTGKKILDIACGTGSQAAVLVEAGHEVIGIDLSEDMLSIARRKVPEATFRQGDASALPFRDNSFDVAIIEMALHEMPLQLAKATFSEAKRIARERIIVLDYSTHPGLAYPLLLLARISETKHYWPYIKAGLDSISGSTEVLAREKALYGMLELTEFTAKSER